jgi:hypothetical protein
MRAPCDCVGAAVIPAGDATFSFIDVHLCVCVCVCVCWCKHPPSALIISSRSSTHPPLSSLTTQDTGRMVDVSVALVEGVSHVVVKDDSSVQVNAL